MVIKTGFVNNIQWNKYFSTKVVVIFIVEKNEQNNSIINVKAENLTMFILFSDKTAENLSIYFNTQTTANISARNLQGLGDRVV